MPPIIFENKTEKCMLDVSVFMEK